MNSKKICDLIIIFLLNTKQKVFPERRLKNTNDEKLFFVSNIIYF